MGITTFTTRVGVASLAAGSVLMAPTLGLGAANLAASDAVPCDSSGGESACSLSAIRDNEGLFGTLEAGTHTFALEGDPPLALVTVDLPNDQWNGRLGWILGTDGFIDSRQGLSIQFWSAPEDVYGDPCRWAGTEIDVEPTVEFVADALASQALRDASPVREITVGDHRGVELELTVPDDIDISTCDGAEFLSWGDGMGGARYHQGAGQHDLVRLIDVDGVLVVVDATFWPELPAETRAEMTQVLDSMRFELPQADSPVNGSDVTERVDACPPRLHVHCPG
jgi:hypothetical protein